MSAFPRIDPEHPLTRAARSVNEYADHNGLEATLDWLGMDITFGELSYLGEQRALRAAAAASGLGDLAASPAPEIDVALLTRTPLWRDMRILLISCQTDGMVIGWKAHEFATDRHDQ